MRSSTPSLSTGCVASAVSSESFYAQVGPTLGWRASIRQAHCGKRGRLWSLACCAANGCSGVYRLPPLAIPAEFRVARGDGSMMESLLANRSAALLAASDEYL